MAKAARSIGDYSTRFAETEKEREFVLQSRCSGLETAPIDIVEQQRRPEHENHAMGQHRSLFDMFILSKSVITDAPVAAPNDARGT